MILLQSQTTQFCNKPTEVGAGNNPALSVTFTETEILYYRCLETGSVSLYLPRARLHKENYNDSYGEGTFVCSNEFLTLILLTWRIW
jgi:hypothetical protein